MGEAVVGRALSVTDSIFVILFIGAVLAGIWLVRWVITKFDEREKEAQRVNNEREQRYITIIDTQAKAINGVEEIRNDVKEIKSLILKG